MNGVPDPLGRVLDYNTPYFWKMRVQTIPGSGSHYSFKLWQMGELEPNYWEVSDLDTDGLLEGSLLLVAHHVDAGFGNAST